MEHALTSTKVYAFAAVAAVGLIGGFFFARQKPGPDPSVAALTCLNAIQAGDAGPLMPYLHPKDVEANKWTEAKLERVINELIRPTLAKVPFTRKGSSTLNPRQGTATVTGLVNGKAVYYNVSLRRTDRGGLTLSPSQAVSQAARLEYTLRTGKAITSVETYRAEIVRFMWDRKDIYESIGFKSQMLWDDENGESVISEIDKRFRDPSLMAQRKKMGIPEGVRFKFAQN